MELNKASGQERCCAGDGLDTGPLAGRMSIKEEDATH